MKLIRVITLNLFFLLTTSYSLAQSLAPIPTTTVSELPEADQPQIFGMKVKLKKAQIKRITDAQKSFKKNYQCIVSYGFYNDIQSALTVLQDWKRFAKGDKERNFHLFLRIGAFSDSHTISAHYRYPPALKDVSEIDKILKNLESDLQTEVGLNNVINQSFITVEDELSYLKNKPKHEAKEQQKVNDFEAEKIRSYLLKIAKIALYITIPILTIIFIWATLSRTLNRRPYLFPDTHYTPRLGAKYTAKSISQIRKQ